MDLNVDRNYLNIKHVTSEDHKLRIQSSNANSLFMQTAMIQYRMAYAGANLALAFTPFSAIETLAQKGEQN